MQGIVSIVLLLIVSFTTMMSFIYGHLVIAYWLYERWPRAKPLRRLLPVALIVAGFALLLIPSYGRGDIPQRGLLPFGVVSHVFLAGMIIWYVLVLSLGLGRLLKEYYRFFTAKNG